MVEIPPRERDTKNLTVALLKAQKSFPAIEADASNPFFGSGYSSLAGIIRLTTQVLSANGLAVSQTFDTDDKGRDLLVTHLRHTSGEAIISHLPLRTTKDDMQALGSAISYARRYSLMAILNIATSHDDDDGNAASRKTAATEEIQF